MSLRSTACMLHQTLTTERLGTCLEQAEKTCNKVKIPSINIGTGTMKVSYLPLTSLPWLTSVDEGIMCNRD